MTKQNKVINNIFVDHYDFGNIDYVDRHSPDNVKYANEKYLNSLNFILGLPPSE